MRKQYKSVKGIWNNGTIIFLIVLFAIGCAEYFLLSPLVAAITVVPMLFAVALFEEKYELNEYELIVYSGRQVRIRLAKTEIQKVEVTKKALLIWYSELDFIKVDPKTREEFIQGLGLAQENIHHKEES